MRKVGYSIILLIIGAIAIVGCSKVNKENTSNEPIKIGVDVFPGWAHVFIAKEKGFFEKNGVNVELVLKEDYLEVQDDFAEGRVDGAFMVYADAIFANDRAIPVKVVYISDQSVTGDVIAAKPGISNIEGLRGKTISVEGINSFSHLFVLKILEENGLGEGDVFFTNIGAQKIVDALEKGEIAAGHTYGPEKTAAKEKGYVFLASAGDIKGIITDVLGFNTKIINEKPEEIKKIVQSLFEAKEFQQENRQKALQIIAQAIGDSPESVGVGIDAVDYFDLKRNLDSMQESSDLSNLYGSGKVIAEFFIERGQISESPDFEEIIQDKFVRDLQ